ncbi:ankyrin repeat domain-containing protein [Exiguobacterium oxidotolerans]|uniref:ankyrin repeat domain-containing protein n=1 Tax=Exiguobacterium oxidotolerans TaxID=223958 RepID=UPI000494C1FF|nr:ankyrin repeat domain-containing protein [Exiguobacterium oxidotolerans]
MKRKRIITVLLILIIIGIGGTMYVIKANQQAALEQGLRSEKPEQLASALKETSLSTKEKNRYIRRFQEAPAFDKAKLLLDEQTVKNKGNWFYAAQFAPLSTVSEWLTKGAKISQLNAQGQSVLHVATSVNRSIDVYALLIKEASKKELNRIDDFGHTPLFYATLDQNEAAIELLLNAGADPNQGKEVPVYETVKQNRKDLYMMLQQNGAEVQNKKVKQLAKQYRATKF